MSLIEDSVSARKAHMTYGQWKLLHPGDPPPRKGHSPIGTRYCEVCGAVLKRRQKRFCSVDCSGRVWKQQKRKDAR